MKLVNPSVICVSSTPDALRVIEAAGRTCYKSEGKATSDSAEAFVRAILRSKHESVIEHASASFRIITSRYISHETVRHRLASYSQESTRYCNYGKKGGEIEVIQQYFCHLELLEGFIAWCEMGERLYLRALELGEKPDQARSFLPPDLKTELVMTANFREWRHFLELRLSRAAHPQIRFIAGEILRWFKANYPVIVEDLEEK